MQPHKLKLSPAHIIMVSILLIGISQLFSVRLLMEQPWIGVDFSPALDSGALRVGSIADASPLAGKLSTNEIITHLVTGDGTQIPLTPLLIINPEQIQTRQKYEEYLALNDKLHKAINSGKVVSFLTISGNLIPFRPSAETTLSQIPHIYWWVVIGGILGIVIGAFVWSYKPGSQAAAFLYIGGIGHYFFSTSGALFIVKDLCFSADIAHLLVSLMLSSLYIFMTGLTVSLALYPERIAQKKITTFILLLTVALIANTFHHWVDFPVHFMLFQFHLILPINYWCLYKQWHYSKNNPINRSALLAVIIAFIIASLSILLFYTMPAILYKPPLISDTIAHFIPVILFVGWAVAILRYRLFEVENWWFRSWLWLLGGCLILLLDMILIWFFNTPKLFTIEISILIAGFLYFPLRQWLLQRLLPSEKYSLRKLLPNFSESITHARTDKEFEQRWREALHQHLLPVHLTIDKAYIETTQLSDNGLHLQVPLIDKKQSYRLTGKNKGTRLFNHTDISMTEALLEIARLVHTASKTREHTILQERERIMHDLHDTVGSRLLTLAHSVPEKYKPAAVESLQTLRDTIKLSLRKSPLTLEYHLAEWRAEIVERTEAYGIELDWQVTKGLKQQSISPKQIIELTHFLREVVSNAIKHAGPDKLGILFVIENDMFCIRVSNNGTTASPDNWETGTGINSMKRRLNALGGELQTHYFQKADIIQVTALVPRTPEKL